MNTALELKTLLQRFNRGVKDVAIEYGIFCIYVTSDRAASGVTLDLLRTRAFKSVKAIPNAKAGKGFIVHAIPA